MPTLFCRHMLFVRTQRSTEQAAGVGGRAGNGASASYKEGESYVENFTFSGRFLSHVAGISWRQLWKEQFSGRFYRYHRQYILAWLFTWASFVIMDNALEIVDVSVSAKNSRRYLLHNGYKYVKNRASPKVIYWRCAERRTEHGRGKGANCSGSIKTNLAMDR